MTVIRAAAPEDACVLAEIYNYYVTETSISYELSPVSETEFSRRIRQISRKYPYLVAEEDGIVAGYAYASSFRSKEAYIWDSELSVYVAEGSRGRRIGTLLMEKLLAILHCMNYVNLYSLVDYPNEGSMALHERFGFTKAGYLKGTGYKLGGWRDTVILEKRLSSLEKPLPIDHDWEKLM